METARDENILPLESFDWLEQDERATFWLWAYICKAGDYELGIDKPANAEFGKNWYQRMNLSVSPTSHQKELILSSLFRQHYYSDPTGKSSQAPGHGQAERPVEKYLQQTSSAEMVT